MRKLLYFGVVVFIGSGGRALKQHVVPPILDRCGNGTARN